MRIFVSIWILSMITNSLAAVGKDYTMAYPVYNIEYQDCASLSSKPPVPINKSIVNSQLVQIINGKTPYAVLSKFSIPKNTICQPSEVQILYQLIFGLVTKVNRLLPHPPYADFMRALYTEGYDWKSTVGKSLLSKGPASWNTVVNTPSTFKKYPASRIKSTTAYIVDKSIVNFVGTYGPLSTTEWAIYGNETISQTTKIIVPTKRVVTTPTTKIQTTRKTTQKTASILTTPSTTQKPTTISTQNTPATATPDNIPKKTRKPKKL